MRKRTFFPLYSKEIVPIVAIKPAGMNFLDFNALGKVPNGRRHKNDHGHHEYCQQHAQQCVVLDTPNSQSCVCCATRTSDKQSRCCGCKLVSSVWFATIRRAQVAGQDEQRTTSFGWGWGDRERGKERQ